MIRMLLLGYCQGIRSERRLCEEVHVNLAYRWFCRLDLTDPVPDHSTFSKNRHGRFRETGLFRHLFETVLQRCIHEGLVGGENFGVHASLIPANANQTRGVESEEGLPPELTTRVVEEYLETLDDAAFGASTKVVPKYISPVDPAARWTGADGGAAFVAYLCGDMAGLFVYLAFVLAQRRVDAEPPEWACQHGIVTTPGACGLGPIGELAMLNNIGLPGLVLPLLVVVELFGRRKISSIMGEVGQGLTAFRRGVKSGQDEHDSSAA